MSYRTVNAVEVKIDGKNKLLEPNELIPTKGNVITTETAVLRDTKTGKEITVEAGGYLSKKKPKKTNNETK